MIRGRRPLPLDQRALRGNPGKRPVDASRALALAPALPNAPRGLSPAAYAEYRRVGQLLKDAKIISKLDRAALTAYAVAWSNWLDAERDVKEHGATTNTPNGYNALNAYAIRAQRAMVMLAARAQDLGLSPASRPRVGALADPAAKLADPIERIFAARQQARQADGPH